MFQIVGIHRNMRWVIVDITPRKIRSHRDAMRWLRNNATDLKQRGITHAWIA